MPIPELQGFLTLSKVYSPDEITEVLRLVRPYFRFSYGNTKVKYFNVPCSFDIETTSFRSTGKDGEEEKTAIMYEWTFGIYGLVIIGRTWNEFTTMLDTLSEALNLDEHKRLCCYVHNLAYEFQFMRKWFIWDKVFSVENRKPIYAVTSIGIEFRCSYLLSGYSLEKLGDELQEYKIRKLVGYLDYDKLRHNKTPLSVDEIAYCVNDVKVVMAYIAEKMVQDGGIARISLTKTGYVRKYCKDSCFYEPGEQKSKSFKRLRYASLMKSLRLSASEYNQLKDAFQGGFTHANPFYSGKVVYDVTSFDFTSSYPCVMIAERFPMSSSERVDITSREEFYKNLKLYCCLFDIELFDVESLITFESYLSESRCTQVKKGVINNGRIVSAEHLITTVTEQDYLIMRKCYKWDTSRERIANFRRYRKDYLPTDFVKAILKLYGDKTTLKGVSGMEVEYLRSKEMLNSCYGMAVTDIVREEHPYTDHWLEGSEIPSVDTQKEIEKYNKNGGRFLFYPWGVWVTAYARRNVWSGILEFGTDYVYSDTDSIKVLNAEKHMDYINEYNNLIRKQLVDAMRYHNLSPDLIEPKTKDNKIKCLGVWDFDGHYSRFKTLGAKRYLVQYSEDSRNSKKDWGKVQITVAGLNKSKAVPFICFDWAYTLDGQELNSPFDKFQRDLYVPSDYTGKMTHTYIDDTREGVIMDYNGIPGKYYELSSVHLEAAEYSLSIPKVYADFIRGVQYVSG